MVVVRGREVLVLRRAHPPRIGRLDVPGGFLEAGEQIEAAARRELREETGLTVGRADWLGLYWDRYYLRGFGYIPTLNFYFLARWRAGVAVAADDAASAEWVPLSSLRAHDPRYSWQHMGPLFGDARRRLKARDRKRS
jgi:ADP-ribose pyrophosphatase YjhB (NUDIX family)